MVKVPGQGTREVAGTTLFIMNADVQEEAGVILIGDSLA